MQTFKTSKESINKAIEVLNNSGIVIIPTETVYGVIARLDDEKAFKKIYEAKNRPLDKPLAIFLANPSEVSDYTQEISKKAKELMRKYWPGPLTLIFKKSEKVPNIICGKLSTVGIRIPDHKIPQAILKECGPLVATSANKSGEPAPTSAQEVTIDADLLIDGGPIMHGKASTVVDVSQDPPLILREGNIHPF